MATSPTDSVTGGYRALVELVARGNVVVLSGAGISTESGIPDYRGPTGSRRPSSPMTFQVFTGDAAARRRYWARSHLGWRTIGRALPNCESVILDDCGHVPQYEHPEKTNGLIRDFLGSRKKTPLRLVR